MPFVIDATDPNTVEQFVLDGLAINDGLAWAIQFEGIDMTPPPMRPEWIGAADSEFQDLVRAPLHENRKIVIPLQGIQGATKTAALDRIGALQDKLTKAAQTPGGIPLTWTPRGSSRTVTFDVLAGEITGLPLDWLFSFKSFPKPTVTLTCKPYWRGVEVDAGTATSSTPFVTKEIVNLAGDVRALGRVVVTDTATQSRRHVEWGLEDPKSYNPAAALLLDSDSLVTSGFAGTQGTRTGAYDPNATGNNIITSFLTTRPQAICGTGVQSHIGTFRVKARVYTQAPSNFYVRLAWRVGDGGYTGNDPANVASGDYFTEIDLGTILIPQASTGTQSWDGRLEAWTTAYTSDDIEVDYLMLIPVEAGYGKVRASYSYGAGVLVARDAFNSTTAGVALNGRTADAGGTWATSGATTDFAFQDSAFGAPRETVTRSTVSDASARFAILGASNFTDTSVAAGIMAESLANTFAGEWGLIARWTDASNYLRGVMLATSPSSVTFNLVQRVAGVDTTLASENLNHLGVTTRQDVSFRLIAFASGRAILQMYDTSATLIAMVEASSPALATGGTLATGKPGLYDFNSSAGAGTRRYDDVYVETPALEPIAVYSGRSLQVRYDDTIRESSAGGTWGRPQSYRGSRFLVPVGTSRLMVKARRNDVDTSADDQITDATQIQVLYTPRGLTVPR